MMKPSATPQENPHGSSSSSDYDESEPTPTEPPQRTPVHRPPPLPSVTTTGRSPLVRSPLSAQSQTPTVSKREEPLASVSTGYDGSLPEHSGSQVNSGLTSGHTGVRGGKDMAQAALHGSLAELKDALSAKMLAQTRGRRSYGSTSGAKADNKRVSPIEEEEGAGRRQSLNTIVGPPSEPVRTTSTISTASTESNRTIRGSVLPTPANVAPRTPSYPFPYIPGTPRWSSQASAGVHEPFTALSPTTPNQPRGDHETPGRERLDVISSGSTPAAASIFMPSGWNFHDPGDPRYPTPDLYDLVLQLNSEPGLEQWWATVTNILHDSFKAERATLVQPIDPNDIENVPWGQKAMFSMNGQEEFLSQEIPIEQSTQTSRSGGWRRPELSVREPSTEASDSRPQKLHPERLRPRLESRHSYAGHGREVKDMLGLLNDPAVRANARPQGPQRTVTHAAGMTTGANHSRMPPKRYQSGSSVRHSSIGDPDFSSVGAIDTGPYAEVFSALRSLDHEMRPLIESGGVCSVLERGRVVAVTRDYVPDAKSSKVAEVAPKSTPRAGKAFGNYRSQVTSDNASQPHRDYEEYEQHPASPWAQSPAPSPAIQADEDSNPFFSSEEQQVDDSFDPGISPKDYSQFGRVEAIGVDHASTVLHIPLIHPTLSQPMQSLKMKPRSTNEPEKLRRSETIDFERKAPIAILSFLTSTVPYPSNLTHILKLLGPHLATSFATAQQFSDTHVRTVSIRHRRTASGHQVTREPMTIEPSLLDDIVNAELEQPPGSMSSSMTSPSDYSGRSHASPSGSIVGTPGWDPASHGWTSSRSVANTPALTGSEIVDNYFEAKKRTSHRTTSNASAANTPAKGAKKSSSADSKASTAIAEDTKSPRSERSLQVSSGTKAEKTPARGPVREPSPARSAGVSSPVHPRRPSLSSFPDFSKESRPHSLLHSYGADFQSTFGVASNATPGELQSPVGNSHARKTSYPEDMPPPSERLLRTIIDSVPVQIFTAQPETGQLSWVNSKFLIYRGQESRQVLNDPWSAIHPQDRGNFLPAWHRSLRTNQQLQQKVRLQRFDGGYRWFYVRAAPLKDKRQHVVHWIGTMMDFHDQQLAEINSARQAETAASEAKYRALANSSPQIVFAVNRTKGVTFCNTQWLHYSGQSESQALGTGFMDHVHPDDLSKCRLPTFEGDSNQPTNVPTSLPPQPSRTVSQSNISSDASSETEKADSATSSSEGAAMSPATSKPPQRQLSELASTGILRVTRDADGRSSYSTEVRLKSKDNNFRWHLVRVLLADPLLNEEEETWYGTCTDINDHKALERDLKETMDEKSRFLSNMSHEIRTPLNGITGMVNFLIDSNLTSEQMEHVNIIRASTEGLRGLINDILDLSKAEAGMIQLNEDWLHVRSLIEDVNDLTSAMAIDKGLELNYIVEEDVPPQIKGDRFRIRQILLNIVGNAIKFTAEGEVFVRCSILESGDELAKNETYIKFEVVDTGRGFTEKEAEFLFKRFSQIDGSSTRQHGGTGLGLVISRQLAQLHGGDMGAKGVQGKGSIFTFYIKTTVPSKYDQPPPPMPGAQSLPGLPTSPAVSPGSTVASLTKVASAEAQARPSPRFLNEISHSPSPHPSPDTGRDSPSISSASSDPSIRSVARTSSLHSERSSASSVVPEPAALVQAPMKLSLPAHAAAAASSSSKGSKSNPDATRATSPQQPTLPPPMFSILVVAPLKYSRQATVQHIDMTLPKNIPHQVTAKESFSECQKLLGGDAAVNFTHVVVVLHDVHEIVGLMDQVWSTSSTTAVILITDLAQRRKIMEEAPNYDYDGLVLGGRLRWVFKPLKPSRFGLIFDPQREREMSLDRNQDSAQQVAVNQKQVFEGLTRRLGNRDKRVLLVEDNRVNQMVILKFLAKVSIKVDTVLDGVQCTDKVFSSPVGYYSIILCDLHMPNKDGYQTCKEIRQWEKKNKSPHLPIIALSANVLGDVYQKCVDAGFNSYMTKPVDFKELSQVLTTFMDPKDPSKPHAFMKMRRTNTSGTQASMR